LRPLRPLKLTARTSARGRVSAEEASLGVAEFWSGDRLIGFTLIEDGDLTLRIGSSADGVVLGAHALAEALAEANRLLALH
jgi:hypothetical protein